MSLKRAFDVVASLTGIALTAAPVLGMAFAMAIVNKAPPFLAQQRMGFRGEKFKMYKITTLRDAFDEHGVPLPDDQRTTRLGRYLRQSRLNELPQLLNILIGDMSFVGPRPAMLHVDFALDEERHRVKPGLTGLAQLKGMNSLTTPEILALDHKYVRTHSFFGDLRIILQTPMSLIVNRNLPHYHRASQACMAFPTRQP